MSLIHTDLACDPGEVGERPIMVNENAHCPDCGKVHDIEKCPKCGAHIDLGFGLLGGGYGPYKTCSNDYCGWMWKQCFADDEE